MIRLLFWLLLGYIAFKIAKGFIAGRQAPQQPEPKHEETFQDPVCGVYVAVEDAVIGRLEGERIHFCSLECLEKYREKLEQKS